VKRTAFPPLLNTYRATDELLARPRTRILLMLRRCDWISAQDLNDMLNLPGISEDRSVRNAYVKQLTRLVCDGLVLRKLNDEPDYERRGGGVYVYSLAPDVDLTIPPPTLVDRRGKVATSRATGDSRYAHMNRVARERFAS
jgi:hypothetical protein